MGFIAASFLSVNGERDETQLPLAPVLDVLANVFRNLPDYGELNDEARDYLRDSIELGLEHLAGACSAWGSGAYFPCETSCRTVFEISVNILYILQAPERRASQHQRACVFHEQKQVRAALQLAEKQGLDGLAKEFSDNLEMLNGQIEIVERFAPAFAGGSATSEKAWPSMRQRLEAVGEDFDYPTLYSVLCRSTHGDAEPLIERRLARIIGHGKRDSREMTRAVLLHFRETTRAFSRMLIAQASFRLMKAAGRFASRYGIRPLLETISTNLEGIRVLDEEAAAEVRALRQSDAWKSAST
ncbi:DUF5677 domain-containing protein [uncultured Thiodictyon sp.]|jgi:hypothetical protein|uniref:DUF5677 domain-containing protein n=1 Tax=uncultured Thiodictyon sp. TaxID=1846217 RepID=UPI0025D4B77B|nr:DUF5677 domain-containing protein [uncultured Thiodictyon sp.]